MNSIMIKLITILLLLMSQSAFGAPEIESVSGNVTHKNTLIISGNNFTTHTNYNVSGTYGGNSFLNRAFKDFEDGVMESDQFYFTHSADNWSIETTGNRSGNSIYYGKKYYKVSRLGALAVTNQTNHTEWFAAFWFRMPTGTYSGKLMRVWSGTTGNDVTIFAGGDNDTGLRGTDGLNTAWGSQAQLSYDTWQRIDFYMRDVSTNDRAVQTWINGAVAWSYVNQPNAWPPYYPYNDSGHTWDFGDLYENAPGGFYFDDIYVSHTRARVEIGNAPTWSASNHREIQIPRSWSASSITITVNRGSFGETDTAYLFVIDSDGNASDGYEITFGDESTPTLTIPGGVTNAGGAGVN